VKAIGGRKGTPSNRFGDVTGIAFFAGYAGGTAAFDRQIMVVFDVDRVLELAPKTSLAA
jgi:hypothetical protein